MMKTSSLSSRARVGVVLLVAAVLSGCASSTPQSRIASNPNLYGALTPAQQGLVSQGRITEGMTKEAVFLAWGRADYEKRASSGGKVVDTWIYSGVEPVYTSYGYGSFHGYGYYDYPYHHFYPGYCYDYGPRVFYRSYAAGKVTFHNGRVTQWETTNR